MNKTKTKKNIYIHIMFYIYKNDMMYIIFHLNVLIFMKQIFNYLY